MTLARMTLSQIYAETCEAYRREFTDSGAEAWENALVGIAVEDVKAALAEWQRNTEEDDYTHRPRGSMMPFGTDLRAIIERKRVQEVRANGRKFCGLPGCVEGWRQVAGGRVARCQDCKKIWQEEKTK